MSGGPDFLEALLERGQNGGRLRNALVSPPNLEHCFSDNEGLLV